MEAFATAGPAAGAQTSTLAPVALRALRGAARAGDAEALRVVARQFESLFLNLLLKSMRETVGEGGLFGSGESRLLTGLLDEQVANRLAERPGIGLADRVLRQIEAAQRAAVGEGGTHREPAGVKPSGAVPISG